EMGTTTVGELIELAGGVSGGRKVKAVIPGGSSVPVMPGAAALDAPYSYEGLQAAGSLLGSGGMIVFAEGTCMVRSLQILLDFYHHESCGQCTPCREGTGWIAKIVGKIERGEGTESDLAALMRITGNMSGTTICALADAAVMPTQSFLKHFREEFVAHVREKRCPVGGALTAAA
ncbi:MAG: NADH-quinone oxidoreductase subunit F, partial [Candidatus Methylomirabilis sp.]|nr:NADH-quinone oxidoreductase subunit F [Deltaproteobacteria bacterium]